MATAKGKRPSSTKKSIPGNSSTKKGTSGRGRKTSSRKDQVFSAAVVGLVLLAIGILLVFCLWIQSNAPAIVGLRTFLNGAFGRLAWLYALLICYGGLQIAFGERWPLRRSAVIPMALLALSFSTLLQIFRLEDLYRMLKTQGYLQNYNGVLWESYEVSKNVPVGGGFVGGLLGYPMGKYLEVVGSVLLLFFVIGGLLLLLVRMFAPGTGERVGGWFMQLRDDWSDRRNERAAQKEENPELLVQIPKELKQQDPIEPKPAKVAGGKRKTPRAAEPVAPSVREPAPPIRQTPPPQKQRPQPAPAQSGRVVPFPGQVALAGNDGRQHKLYIEDILPADYSPHRDVYADFGAERGKDRDRPPRSREGVLPDFIAKGRDAYEKVYGALGKTDIHEDEGEPTSWIGEPAAYDGEVSAESRYGDLDAEDEIARPSGSYTEETYIDREREPYDALLDDAEAFPGEEPVVEERPAADDAPWEPVEPTYASEGAGFVRTRRHRPQRQNPLDAQPQPAPETRLDRADWKRPEPLASGAKIVQLPSAEVEEYRQPPFSLLERDDRRGRTDTREEDETGAQKLEETLRSFGVEARVIRVVHGPAITRYELQPAPGVKVSKIVSLTDDIALNMAAVGVRIEAPIPGKAAIGIEIANDEIDTVHLRDVLESDESLRHPSRLAVALGKDVAGKRIIADLARMPHLLIAGATGSGKSVCINTLITSIIYRAKPEEVRLILIDPKKVELSVYNDIPHLLVPVVTDPKKANGALSWAVMEMDERYKLFAEIGVRDIRGYNTRRKPETLLMPQIVVIIDELSDLMLVAPGEVEESICRLALVARACGIPLVIATQRPSVNVITGIIKANIPSRIAFAVSSHIDSRTILDSAGAEKLLGKGDMLYAPSGGGKPLRVQGCFVSDDEVARVTEYVKERHKTEYSQAVIDALKVEEEGDGAVEEEQNDLGSDALFEQAVEIAIESGQTSISMLQRRLRIGYARAGRLIDDMSRMNIISQADGAKPREVLITREDFQLMFRE